MLTFRTIADLFEDYEAAPTDHASDTGYWHFHDVTLKVGVGPFAAGERGRARDPPLLRVTKVELRIIELGCVWALWSLINLRQTCVPSCRRPCGCLRRRRR